MDPRAQQVFEDIGGADSDRQQLTAQGPRVAGSEPGFVIEKDLSEGPVQDDFRCDCRDGPVAQCSARRRDPVGSGNGIVVEQADDRAAGVAQAELDAPREAEVHRRADNLRSHRPGNGRGFFIRRPVVDHDHLVRLRHGGRETRCEPVAGAKRDDDHRSIRWHHRVATTFP